MMKRVRPPLTPLRGGPFQIELEALFQKPKGVPFALTRVPRADNRTEILSPTNKQYKGRKRALRAVQMVPSAKEQARSLRRSKRSLF